MAIALRRFGEEMGAWVAGCVVVGSAVALWDVVTKLWLFNPLFRFYQGTLAGAGIGAALLRWGAGLFIFDWPVWTFWAVTIGASVAVLAWPKFPRYRVAALFGIGFGPALGTILEGYSPIHGEPMALLVPLWLLVIAADTFVIWGLAWCIVGLAKRAVMAKQETQKLRQLGGLPVIGRAVGFTAIFAGGEAGERMLLDFRLERCERRARFNPAKARRDFSREMWKQVPVLLRESKDEYCSRHRWSRFLVPRTR